MLSIGYSIPLNIMTGIRNIMPHMSVAMIWVLTIADTNMPSPRESRMYITDIRIIQKKLPATGTFRTKTVRRRMIMSTAQLITKYGIILDSTMLIGFTGETRSTSMLPVSFSLTIETEVIREHISISIKPIMPGVLILEALAQTGAVAALSLEENRGKLAIFGGVKNARFKQPVLPGDVLELSCELVEQHGPIGFGKAVAKVDGKIAARCELTFVIQ